MVVVLTSIYIAGCQGEALCGICLICLRCSFPLPHNTLSLSVAEKSVFGEDELTPSISPEQVKFAFINSPLTCNRLTLGDLLIFLGWDQEQIWQRARDIGRNLVHE